MELKKLTQWAKKTAHEKDVYKKLIVELNDISGNEYDSITLEKAFVVKYEQSFDGEKGEGEFYILIRSLDNMNDVFGQAWDRTAWDIDEETLIGNESQVERASRALGVEYTSILMEEDKFVKSLEQMNLKELEEKLKKLKFLETITKSSLFIPGMSSNMEMNLKYQSMIEKEINKRKQNDNPKVIEISPWLIGYKGRPNISGGRSVTYSIEDWNKLKEIEGVHNIDWYSYENQKEPNEFTSPYLKNREFNIGSYGELTDENGRYWVTLGPKVFKPNYSDTGELRTEEFSEFIGCRIDVILKHDKDEFYVYIECVYSGNIKAHTYNNGVFQTGYPYPNSYSAIVEPYKVEYVNGSIVEFTGAWPSTNGDMSKYSLVEMIVYN